jgi:hypothetical protein
MLLLTLASFHLFAQENWKLSKDKNGIKVYTASNDSSKFKAVKVECEMPGTFDKLISILQDVPKHTEWVYSTKRAYLVKKVSNDELIYYAETTIPWPMTNRDAVIKMVNIKDTVHNTLLVTQKSVSDLVPSNSGIVRIGSMDGRYEVSAGDNKLHLVYYLKIDPAGDMPAWIVNLFCTKGPYETFSALIDKMKN